MDTVDDHDAAGKKGGKHEDDKKGTQVHFRHLGERETANFRVDPRVTLKEMWDTAYTELEIERDERDILQAPRPGGNPMSLMEHLSLSLDEAQDRDLCETRFEIAARTGGA